MKRVLQINISNDTYGGVQAFLVNVYRKIDTSKVQFDFLSPNEGPGYKDVKEEFRKKGSHFFNLGNPRKTVFQKIKYSSDLKKFLRKHPYEIVHIHTGVLPFAAMNAHVARKCGVKKVIVHSHNYDPNRPFLKRMIDFFLRRPLERDANVLLACSNFASKGLYTKHAIENGNVEIINNGISIDKYRFDLETRSNIRKKLGLNEDDFVYGNIGRLEGQKNHSFLLEVFEAIKRRQKKAKLIIVGSGILEKEIKEKINALRLDDSVIILDFQKDVEKFYSVFDVFILPSLFEGFPMVTVEASVSNLKMFCSDTITREIEKIGDVEYLSLGQSVEDWAAVILSKVNDGKKDRSLVNNALTKHKYDIVDTVSALTRIYVGSEKEV